MPIYEFACQDKECDQHADQLRKYETRDDPTTCACGSPMTRIFSMTHCPPDGVYSYAPNLGCPERFERQREAIRTGRKVIPRKPDLPRDHRDGQLTPRRA